MERDLQYENERMERELRALKEHFTALLTGAVELVPSKDIGDDKPSNVHTLPLYLTSMLVCTYEGLGEPLPKDIEWKGIAALDDYKPEECDTLDIDFKSLERRNQNDAS